MTGSPAASASTVWLTTLGLDGAPHTTPVWFWTPPGDELRTVWVATSLATAKTRNLDADPRVSLAVDGSGADPDVALGRARVHRRPRDHDVVLAGFAQKYGGWDAADERQWGTRVLLEIDVERWLLGGPR